MDSPYDLLGFWQSIGNLLVGAPQIVIICDHMVVSLNGVYPQMGGLLLFLTSCPTKKAKGRCRDPRPNAKLAGSN